MRMTRITWPFKLSENFFEYDRYIDVFPSLKTALEAQCDAEGEEKNYLKI